MSYIRIEKNETCEITEKKSRFIAYLAYGTTEEDAQNFVSQIKKKHYDARHNVSAVSYTHLGAVRLCAQ